MSSDARPAASPLELDRFVRRLGADHDVAIAGVEWVPGCGGAVEGGSGGWRVQLGADMLGDTATARFVAAHEVGHLALGHVGRKTLPVLAAVLTGLMVACLAAGSVLGCLWAGTPGASVGLGGAGWVGLLLIRQVWVVWSRHTELAADQFAHANGCPLTPAVARRLRRAEPSVALVDRLFPSHPSWARRLAVSA